MPISGFESEVIYVYTDMKSDRWPTVPVLSNPAIREFGGRSFVSGEIITRGTSHWASGRRCHIPLDRVVAVIEMGSYEEFMKRESTAPPAPARGFWQRLAGRSRKRN